MPYMNNDALPDGVKNVLPSSAQSIFRNAFNSVSAKGATEESANKQAWAAVKNAGYKKDGESGKWKLEKSDVVNIVKVDETKQLVFGFFNINKVGDELVFDSQQDAIPTEELEKAAYNYVLDARVQGDRHVRKGVGRLVESIVLTYEKQEAIKKCLEAQGIIAEINLGCEGWFGGFKVDDEDVWQSILKGDYPAFSIGGSGKRLPVED